MMQNDKRGFQMHGTDNDSPTPTCVRTLLLIGGDKDSCDELADLLLERAGFATRKAYTASEGVEAAELAPDAILLDVDLPDMDGRDACRIIRRRKVFVPIIMIGDSAGEAHAALGLDAGADDYICRPIEFDMLLTRVLAHINFHEVGRRIAKRGDA